MTTHPLRRFLPAVLVLGLAAGTATALLPAAAEPLAPASARASDWLTDPAWYDGKAEWALYDAVRPIYGVPRRYEATLFTNKQATDSATTTKSAGAGGFEVFKHNLSEMIAVENYMYRFLTTAFVRTADLEPYKVVASTQEDCGTSYKQFVVEDAAVKATQYCYFPGGGGDPAAYAATPNLAFHDALSLTLRDYPFDAPVPQTLDLVPDQTDTHRTELRPGKATVNYVGRAALTLPYGSVEAHELSVTHARDGGTTTSRYWFAADPALRHVMAKYEGPYGVKYELKELGWWAYWNSGTPAPRRK